MIRNEISLTITRRYEIQKIYEGRVLSTRKNAKIRKCEKNVYEDYIFTRVLGVWPRCSPPKRIPRCVSRCATKAQQVRAAHRKERTLERKPTPTIIFPFFFLPLFLSLSLSFFSSVEYNSSPCSKILKIVVPADVSQWH